VHLVYNWRALVEADIGRYKRVIGDALRSPTEGRQTIDQIFGKCESQLRNLPDNREYTLRLF
jgi:hypothetical protein